MDKYTYTIEELKFALSNYVNDDGKALFSIVKNVFDGYTQNTFHQIFTQDYSNIQNKSHLENITSFKLNLLSIFFESVESTDWDYKLFFVNEKFKPYKKLDVATDKLISKISEDILKVEVSDIPSFEPNSLSIILDLIITNILYRTDDVQFKLIDIRGKYPDIINSKEVSELLISALSACVTTTRLNKNQKELLEKYDTINSSKYITIDYNENDQIIISADPHYDRHLRNLNNDTILQMYLLGDSSVSPMSYTNIMSMTTDKGESQNTYDNFVIWLWNFAQDKKVDRSVPTQLKSFCIELLQIVSDASTGTKYTKRDFPLNQLDNAWSNFRSANANAKTR